MSIERIGVIGAGRIGTMRARLAAQHPAVNFIAVSDLNRDAAQALATGLEAHKRIHRTADLHLLLAKIYAALNNAVEYRNQLSLYASENPRSPTAARIRMALKTNQP